jgi:nucleotide-binding universal stress UspA family protein
MIRSLLLGVDSTPGSLAAEKLAFDLATRLDVTLAGIDILDAGRVVTREPVPLGALAFKAEGDAKRLKDAAVRWERERTRFQSAAATRGLACDVIMASGTTEAALAEAGPGHDALMLGRDASFGVGNDAALPGFVGTLLKSTPGPVFLVPADAAPISRVLIAYDGSVPAARALQMFALLGLARLGTVSVVSVSPDPARGERVAAGAVAFLARHDVAASPVVIASGDDPAAALSATAREQGATLLVMGAYGHRGWRERLLGSCTTRLLETCPVTLFVHH